MGAGSGAVALGLEVVGVAAAAAVDELLAALAGGVEEEAAEQSLAAAAGRGQVAQVCEVRGAQAEPGHRVGTSPASALPAAPEKPARLRCPLATLCLLPAGISAPACPTAPVPAVLLLPRLTAWWPQDLEDLARVQEQPREPPPGLLCSPLLAAPTVPSATPRPRALTQHRLLARVAALAGAALGGTRAAAVSGAAGAGHLPAAGTAALVQRILHLRDVVAVPGLGCGAQHRHAGRAAERGPSSCPAPQGQTSTIPSPVHSCTTRSSGQCQAAAAPEASQDVSRALTCPWLLSFSHMRGRAGPGRERQQGCEEEEEAAG